MTRVMHSNQLYSFLKENLGPNKAIFFRPKDPETTRFRIHFHDRFDERFRKISVVVLPNDWHTQEGDPATIFETALVDMKGNLTYISELGYGDVRQFESMEAVLAEVQRLADVQKGALLMPDSATSSHHGVSTPSITVF